MRRKLTITAAAATLASAGALLAGCGGASNSGSAAAPAPAQATTKVVTVAMHDPGCHWFSSGGKLTKQMSASGPVALRNADEATLIVAGQGQTYRVPVGSQKALPSGTYRINMVNQAPDDNTLHLTVS